MAPDQWLDAACADAERRGLPELKPLLEALARSTAALRGHERQYVAETREQVENPPR